MSQIISDPATQGGAPCIAGTRITVRAIKDFHKAGYDTAGIIKEYPSLTADDVAAAIAYTKKPPRNGKSCRQKGDGFEREFVNFMLDGDVPAIRVPLSGSTNYQHGDVRLKPKCWPDPMFGELKRRKNLPEWIVNALGEHDFMAMREDRGKTLVVISAELFRDLLQ